MNYSSYLGSKKCDKVICTKGPPGPPGPPGKILNTFTLFSSPAYYNNSNNSIVWTMDIPFVYGKQFIFTFHTNNTVVDSYTPTPTNDYELISTNNYIFGTGQAVYQPYNITTMGVTHTNNGYLIDIISKRGPLDGHNFEFKPFVDIPNNTINYTITYYTISNTTFNEHFSNSTIQLNGTKC